VEVDAPQAIYDAIGTWRKLLIPMPMLSDYFGWENSDKDAAYIEGPNGKIYNGLNYIPNIEG